MTGIKKRSIFTYKKKELTLCNGAEVGSWYEKIVSNIGVFWSLMPPT